MNSFRPSPVMTPEATSTLDGLYSSIFGLSVLMNCPGPSAGVPVSSRRPLAVLVTLIEYQSGSEAVPTCTSSTYHPSKLLAMLSTVSNRKRIWTFWPANAARLAVAARQVLLSGRPLLLVLERTVLNVAKLLLLTCTLATSKLPLPSV